MFGEDFASKLPKFPLGDTSANLSHQALVETEVMDGQEYAGEHLAGHGQVTKVTSRKIAASIARTLRIKRGSVGLVIEVF